ncbi:hypothetical protein D781_3801 [Serratia sp. FGI94]|uniref:hypothetical protein n=1 Tax=Serratia sp. FGI94 TaxID=671990 RepID=UPI0002A6FA03|nr:hypothetical protein [Serratia sp. FGI94]AGB83997.1 hypothetical protein D781_3801 [Serratia sp. FGI94]
MLNATSNTKDIVLKEVSFICNQENIFDDEIIVTEHSDLTNELNFSSLMLARLVMVLNDKFGTEPFSKDFHFSEVKVVSDVISAYKTPKTTINTTKTEG